MSQDTSSQYWQEEAAGFGQIISFMANPISQSRSEQREPRSLSLEIQPLDDDFQPTGNPFWSVSRDVSVHGLGFLMPDQVEHRYLRISLFDNQSSVIAEVRHCSSIGSEYPLYLVGVLFLDD
jgi:hypothetical protein